MAAPEQAPSVAGAHTVADVERLARAALDAGVWDFVTGGAGGERTLSANVAAFERVRFRPRVLTGAAAVDPATTILGRPWRLPLAVAPMAYHTLVDPDGEVATVRAAGRAGIPTVVSMLAGRSIEDIAEAATAPLWLQLYLLRDRTVNRTLVDRAVAAGFEAVVLTVDAPVLGTRDRDRRNGFRLPERIRPANLSGDGFASPADHARTEFDGALDWEAVEWLRTVSPIPVLIKGILHPSDARRAVAAGADGIVVSNHGGRQLDGAIATLDALADIAAEVPGGLPLLLDGGVRRGADILAALAAGADGVLIGRPVIHGLAAGGQAGVERVLGILDTELTEAMRLTGAASVSALDPRLMWGGDRPSRPSSDRTAVLREDELHAGLSDPVLGTMTFLNEITLRYPDAISFAPGRPYDGYFDTEDVFKHLRRYLEHLRQGGDSPEKIREAIFQYGPTAGQIREVLAESLRRDEGIHVPPESIVVTVGGQEAMFLALRALIADHRDVLFVPSPCYVGITGAARLLDIAPVTVPERDDGFHCADLAAAVEEARSRGLRARAFYVVPDHSNPTGTTMSLGARRELLDLAARLDLLILEDSPYRLVSPGAQVPTLKALDRDRRVVHLGTFSKTLFPGARVGYAVADQRVVGPDGRTTLLADALAKVKSMVTVNTPSLSQAVVAGMLLGGGGGAAELNVAAAEHYGEAMRTTLSRLDAEFPAGRRAELGVRWNRPTGGFFLTMAVPFTADEAALTRSAQDFGVIWTPMSYFYLGAGGTETIRLSVSGLSRPEIVEGVARLARFVESRSPSKAV